MKSTLLHLFLLVGVSIIICSCTSKQNSSNKQSDLTKQGDLTKQNPLTPEAEVVAKRFWDNLILKCGDSYYAFAVYRKLGEKDLDRLHEFKSYTVSVEEIPVPSPTPTPKPLTEADRLNQIEESKTANKYITEWDGYIKLNVGVNRTFISSQQGGWGKWQDEMSEEAKLHSWIRLTKVNGRWLYTKTYKSVVDYDYFEFMQKISPKINCSQIPKQIVYK